MSESFTTQSVAAGRPGWRASISPARPLAIVAALPEELGDLQHVLRTGPHRVEHAGQRDFLIGALWDMPVVLTLARVGKVAAAATATALIHRFEVGALLMVGVAGGLGTGVEVGDIVVADSLLQHDLDASPLFPRYEVPLLGTARFSVDQTLREALGAAVDGFIAQAPGPARRHVGLVVSGDQFIHTHAAHQALCEQFPDALAVEMEGAAVAQVCHEYGVPCAVLRTISDRADAAAATSFTAFLPALAGRTARGVLERLLRAPA